MALKGIKIWGTWVYKIKEIKIISEIKWQKYKLISLTVHGSLARYSYFYSLGFNSFGKFQLNRVTVTHKKFWTKYSNSPVANS